MADLFVPLLNGAAQNFCAAGLDSVEKCGNMAAIKPNERSFCLSE
jgi:hypothetical protein